MVWRLGPCESLLSMTAYSPDYHSVSETFLTRLLNLFANALPVESGDYSDSVIGLSLLVATFVTNVAPLAVCRFPLPRPVKRGG